MDESNDFREWFRFADMDLDSAQILFDKMYKKPLEIICFHCQQAAEKYIKGVMLYFGYDVIKTHDLVRLSKVLKDKTNISSIAYECSFLTQFAVFSRYPIVINIDEAQAKVALEQAEKVKKWAEQVVSDK